ncbi:MAG: hypothetical protein AAFQ41_15050, partial [Cyanobacteria bacterium J06623_7]
MHQIKLPQELENVRSKSGKLSRRSPELAAAATTEVRSEPKLKAKLIYTLGNIITRPQYFLVFVLARFHILRRIHRFCLDLKQKVSFQGDSAATLFKQIDPTQALATLKRDGICLGLNLPQNFLKSLQQYLATQDCYAGGRTDLGFKLTEKPQLDQHLSQPFYVARYFNLSQNCPQVRELAQDPHLLTIARGYIGQQAQYTGSSLFWTFPIEGESLDSEQQMFRYFHYDIDDFAGLRFCFYLTDVSLDDGPHICVRGSHIKKRL